MQALVQSRDKIFNTILHEMILSQLSDQKRYYSMEQPKKMVQKKVIGAKALVTPGNAAPI